MMNFALMSFSQHQTSGVQKRRNIPTRAGLTLVELVIVIAILAILAALIVNSFSGMTEQAGLASGMSNVADVGRTIQTYEARYQSSPWGMGTLRSGADGKGALITTLHQTLASYLQTADLNATQMQSLNAAGIHMAHGHNSTASTAPSDSEGGAHIYFNGTGGATTAPVTIIKKEDVGNFSPSTWKASTNMLSRGLGVSPFGAEYAETHVVFGVGNLGAMRGKVMQEAPLITTVNPQQFFARAIAVYRIPADGSKAKFKGVIGPDGGFISKYQEDYNKTLQ